MGFTISIGFFTAAKNVLRFLSVPKSGTREGKTRLLGQINTWHELDGLGQRDPPMGPGSTIRLLQRESDPAVSEMVFFSNFNLDAIVRELSASPDHRVWGLQRLTPAMRVCLARSQRVGYAADRLP